VEFPKSLPLLSMIPHHAQSVNAPFPLIFFAWRLQPRFARFGHKHCGLPVTSLEYRPEDRFQERLNAERLKELFELEDYQGLLEFALLMNHQASFNNSRAYWAISQAALNMSKEFSLDKYMPAVTELTDATDGT
jgi:hypothetical protein